jgi:hypothetical protein
MLSGLCSFPSPFFLNLKALKSLNLHHEIKLLLLLNILLLELLRFNELFVSHSNNLGVKNNLVHFFDVV